MKRMLTEREAWLKLAHGVETGRYSTGLCCGLRSMSAVAQIASAEVMMARLEKLPGRYTFDGGQSPTGLWVWPLRTMEGNQARIAYCMRQARRCAKMEQAKRKAGAMHKRMVVRCDCAFDGGGGKCPSCTGEAVYVCERPGADKPLHLCTRCYLGTDKRTGRLYEEKDIPRLAALDEGAVADADENAMGKIVKMLILQDYLHLPLVS